jgi:serine phosphatase RsbU (regulator of sigma subunit)
MYDVHRLGTDRVGFSLADASGHGLQAALLHGMLKQSFRSHLTHWWNGALREPAEVLERVNRDLLATAFQDGQFVCAGHVVYDRQTRTLSYARCGLPYPVLIRRGESPRQLVSEGRILGAFEDVACESVTVRLEVGDRLLLFTDGLEALLVHGCPAVERLPDTPWYQSLERLDNQAAVSDVAERLHATREQDWPADDVTLMALEVTD